MINGNPFFDPLSIIMFHFRADELIKHFNEQYG